MKSCPFDGGDMLKLVRTFRVMGQYGIAGRPDDGVGRHIEYSCERCGATVNNYNGVWLVFGPVGLYGIGNFMGVAVATDFKE